MDCRFYSCLRNPKMRKLITFFVILFFINDGYSQLKKENILIGLEFNQLTYENLQTKYGCGVELQYFVTDYFGFNSHLIFGENYVHLPIGIVGIAAAIMSGGSCNDCGDLDGCNSLFFLAILSDGVIFHISVFGKPIISPYINPLGLDLLYEKVKGTNTYFTGSLGLKFNYLFGKKFNFSPFTEVKWVYGQRTAGVSCGLSFGYSF
jgi:hypothetical protein